MREVIIKNMVKASLEAQPDKRTICGYWSVFGNVDKQGDIMQKGCFTKTLNENPRGFKYCFNHNLYDGVIGKSIVTREDDKGLYVEAKVSDTPLGNYVLTLAQDGVLDRHSIGFSIIKSQDDKGRRIIQEVRLYEGSILSVEPANDAATVDAIKRKYFFFGAEKPQELPTPAARHEADARADVVHFYPPALPHDFFSNLKTPFKSKDYGY